MTDQTNMKGIQLKTVYARIFIQTKAEFYRLCRKLLVPGNACWSHLMDIFSNVHHQNFNVFYLFNYIFIRKLLQLWSHEIKDTQADQKEGIQPMARGKVGKVSDHESGN